MIVSYNWLNSYFKNQLPKVEELAPKITMGLFEVEEFHEVGGKDYAMDFKILPDRAGYCYAHRFLAQEMSAVLGLKAEFREFNSIERVKSNHEVEVQDTDLCSVYVCTTIKNIKNGSSPAWLADRLNAVGQKSINTIVDLTNYVMLDVGQPLHAFDADKVSGNIVVRNAKEGEVIELLDGRKIELDPTVLIIADSEGPLALAGVKGGKKAEVTESTTNIILEAAHFNPVYVRKTSQRFNIKNDSTKRFENNVTPERTLMAENEFVHLLKAESPEVIVSEVIQIGDINTDLRYVETTVSYINARLGLQISADTFVHILNSLDLKAECSDGDALKITVPVYRNDIEIAEDIADEIGRVNGYEVLEGILPKHEYVRILNPQYVYPNRIRLALASLGFSEVYTYTLRETGDYALSNPLNSERSHLRNRVSDAFPEILEKNVLHLDYLNLNKVAIFEIGNVFEGKKEKLSLALGVSAREGKSKALLIQQALDVAIDSIAQIFNIEPSRFPKSVYAEGVVEIDLETLIASAETPNTETDLPMSQTMQYSKVSPYPYMVRDIAVFIPGPSGKAQELKKLIESVNSPLIVSLRQFDEFEKKNKDTGEVEKTSYAFRMIFQSFEKTLTDEEIQQVMAIITEKISQNAGWEIR